MKIVKGHEEGKTGRVIRVIKSGNLEVKDRRCIKKARMNG